MPGIYIHIPFCKRACHYCDFHFTTSLKHRGEVLESLRQEIFLRKEYLNGAPVDTIYFGGGTPSLLSRKELNLLLEAIQKVHPVVPGCEITLEANPDDLDRAKVRDLRKTGVNRLSIGVQSFFDEDLQWMNRAHTGAEALESVKRVQDAGFENLTADLIYGFPLLTDQKWLQNISTFTRLGIPHLSCYNLTVEEGTALAAFIRSGKQQKPSDEQGARQFRILMDAMEEAGFLHYEISNFCREGHYSRHNTAYWQEKAYLGIGPAAHSYNGRQRSWNIRNNFRYMEGIIRKEPACETERLSTNDRINERIMTELRTMWGLNLSKIAGDFGPDTLAALRSSAARYIQSGWIESDERHFRLSREGKLYADKIAADLFFLDE